MNLVRYVLNSDEVVNLGDVISEKAFARDPTCYSISLAPFCVCR